MRSSTEFRHAVRQGVRTGRATLVVHAAPTAAPGVRVGFVVAKSVGNAVTRNRLRRQLRHLAGRHLSSTPTGTAVVVRALPAAAAHPGELAADLAAAWAKAMQRLTRSSRHSTSPATS